MAEDEARHVHPYETGNAKGPVQFFGPRKVETPGGIATSVVEHTFDVSKETRKSVVPQVPVTDTTPDQESGDSENGTPEADAGDD